MRTKVTLALVFLNVALFFFIFYLKANIAPPQPKGTILGPEVSNLQSIEIVGVNRANTVRLEKRGESWNLTQPVEWPANGNAVSVILTELQQLRSEASFAVNDLSKNGQSLADYGLDKPALTVTLTPAASNPGLPAAHASILRLGDTAKVGNRLYILSPDGERVHVVKRSLAESLAIKLEDLRASEIFSISVFEVRSLNLQTGAPANSKVRIARNNSRWFFETPIAARANKSETDVTISRLNALRIRSFVDTRTADSLRLTPEEMTLRVTLDGNNRRETLILGAKVKPTPASPAATAPAAPIDPTATSTGSASPDTPADSELYYAKMDEKSPVFTVAVPTALLKTIATAQEELRDRRILDFDAATVTGLTVSAPGQPEITLQRLESTAAAPLSGAWQMLQRSTDQGPQALPADREVVDRLLQRLTELSAKEFTTDAPTEIDLENFGFNRPARKVRLTMGNAGSTPATSANPGSVLLVGIGGVGADRHVYAKLEAPAPNYVYQVSDDIVSQIPIDRLAYRERVLRDLPAGGKLTALKLVDLSNESVLLDVTLPLPPAEAAGPANPNKLPRAAVEKLAGLLSTIRAKRFVQDRFSNRVGVAGEERPWRYQLTSTISLVGGNGAQTVTSTLFFSERVGGNLQLVGSADPGFDAIFEAEQPLVDALFAITYGPRDPGPTPPTPEQVEAEKSSK